MTLQEFLDASTDHEPRVWAETAALLEREGQDAVKDNFEAECRLLRTTWEEVFAVLPQPSWNAFRAAVVQVAREHTLEGPEIPNTPQPKGRAIGAGEFDELVKEAYPHWLPWQRTQFLDDVRSGFRSAIPYEQQIADCRLGRHLLWATFGRDDPDPFHGCADAGEVRTRLGLTSPDNPADWELILCLYNLPSSVQARYPTIIEAYAANDWNPLFRCSNPGDPCGFTSGGWPEVVHDVVEGRALAALPRSGASATPPLRSIT